MKAAFQKDDVFLEDVRQAIGSRKAKLWWLGQSGFLIVQNGRAIVLDPYLSDSLTRKYQNTDKPHLRITERVVDPAALGAIGVIDLITSSHNHTDHLDPETLVPLFTANPKARFVLPAANVTLALQRLPLTTHLEIAGLDAGQSHRLSDIEITGIASAHPTVERDAQGRCIFLGYVIRWGNLGFYHSGDTLLYPGLAPALKGFQIDFALLPINGDRPERRVAGNLDGAQASRLAHEIGASCVIPCHYDLFEFNTATPDEFAAECRKVGQAYRIVRNGEGLDL